ncbi:MULTISPECIES: cell division protein FtsQ/DivIB [Myroides]|uniref:cell division protein FtsQ/DivIB n=1 Tax=Myroides TaxID=76831 RepID=UPI001302F349|nr:cell division protein FtsQ/DivIB [Myroides phaeus]
MKKWVKNIKWSDIRILLLCLVLLFIYSFTNKRNDSRVITDIEVLFKGGEEHFVTATEVRDLVKNNFPKISEINRTVLDLNNLEKGVLNNDLIKDADVYLTVDGRLFVDVWQKKAIGRIIEDSKNYYLDEYGQRMPLSIHYSDRVPMVQGKVNQSNEKDLKEMLELINEDEFLRKDITGIIVESDRSLKLMSRTNNFDIQFGGFDEKEKKLKNYKAFVQYMVNEDIEQNKYKVVNLKFTQQVICTK